MKSVYFTILTACAFLHSAPALSTNNSDNLLATNDNEVRTSTNATINWIDLEENEDYLGRHEASFVQAGDKFYLFGGREQARRLDTYDFKHNQWSQSEMAPIEFNHFQATEYQGLIWVIGAFKTNAFPDEVPAEHIYVYNPAKNKWIQGPLIPADRQRGSAGLVVYDGKFYIAGGNTQGHNGGYVAWFDEFDPQTGKWTRLQDAPRARDHFHTIVVDEYMYMIGGRLSGGEGGFFAPLIAQIDVYNFVTKQWSTLPSVTDFPLPRAASAMAFFNGEILVMGGEGDGKAYMRVDSFNTRTQRWSEVQAMHYPRHGTQAIQSGEGVFIAVGSPKMGGGNQKNMEVFGANKPLSNKLTAGVIAINTQMKLSANETNNRRQSSHYQLTIEHVLGSTGVYITDVSLTDVDNKPTLDKTLNIEDITLPFLVPVGHKRVIPITLDKTTKALLESSTYRIKVSYDNSEYALPN